MRKFRIERKGEYREDRRNIECEIKERKNYVMKRI